MGGNVSRHIACNWFESLIVTSAIAAKLRDLNAHTISSIRSRVICGLSSIILEVWSELCIPAVLPIDFLRSEAMRTRRRRLGQALSGITCSEIESTPDSSVPEFHLTNPPCIERHAEPDPCRAIELNSTSCSIPSATARANVKEARPDALDATLGVNNNYSTWSCHDKNKFYSA